MNKKLICASKGAKLFFSGVVCAILFVGCASQNQMYYWGSYEQLIQDSYLKPGTAESGVQIEKLSADIDKAESNGKKVPPGLYAQLGYMYAIEGNVAKSNEAFLQEKALFPESALFIDGMLKRAKQANEGDAK